MNFKKISNQELISDFQKLVSSERKITHLVLLHILEIEQRRLYAEFGYESIFSYLTKHFGYGESSAYRRIQSARLLKQVPQVSGLLESGSINLSQLTQVQKCIKAENSKGVFVSSIKTQDILEKIENKTTFETNAILAKEFNQPVCVNEIAKPQKDDSIRLEITLSQEEYETLKQAKDLLSHICTDGSWKDVIVTLAKKFNRTKLGKNKSSSSIDTMKKQGDLEAQSSNLIMQNSKTNDDDSKIKLSSRKSKMTSTQSFVQEQFLPQKLRPFISVATRRELLEKANHTCEYKNKNTGKKCTSTYQLEIDHIKPVAMDGDSSVNNLRILCKTHNQLQAYRGGLIS